MLVGQVAQDTTDALCVKEIVTEMVIAIPACIASNVEVRKFPAVHKVTLANTVAWISVTHEGLQAHLVQQANGV